MRDDGEPNGSGTTETAPDGSLGIRPRQLGVAPLSADRLRARRGRTAHRRFAPNVPPHPQWATFASQRHVRDVAVGSDGIRVWIATWGGVLCWTPGDGYVERHGSEHGLVGNATRSIAVDRSGIIWAAQDGALCSLDLNGQHGWEQHGDLVGWTVTHVRARAAGGVVLAARDRDGHGTIAEIEARGAPLGIRLRSHLACEDVAAVVPAADGSLWLGNPWGVFHLQGNTPTHYDLSVDDEGNRAVQQQVRSLALADGDTVWVGTEWGLYRLSPTRRPRHEAVSAVRGAIRSLAIDSARDHLLVLTDDSIGTWDGMEWRPRPVTVSGLQNVVVSASIDGAERAWIGGADGLREIGVTALDEAFPTSAEDALSNTVNAIAAAAADAWVGTARGIFHYAAEWRPVEGDGAEPGQRAPVRWDVRALARASAQRAMWAATWDQGLRNFAEDVYIPGPTSATPVVAVTAAEDGAIWFATPDAIYLALAGEIHAQRRLALPDDAGVIRALCYQSAARNASAPAPILWIGTSTGLLACRPDLQLWDDAPAALRGVPVNVLAIDPRDGSLWAGTRDGLFSEHQWNRHTDEEVRAAAFGVMPDESLWLGTSSGLGHWRVSASAGGPEITFLARWTAADSGLAADGVTALSVGSRDAKCELWAGSRSGISRLRYEPVRT